MRVSVLAVAAALSLGATGAQAVSVTSFSNAAAYNAAVGAEQFFFDFNTAPAITNGNFPGQVDFNTPDAVNPAFVSFSGTAMTDTGSTVSSNGVGFLEGVFAAPTFAFRMDILSGTIEGVRLLNGASVVDTVSLPATSGFVGILSDTSFDTFQLVPSILTSGPGAGGNDRVFIDNFGINVPAPVPLPPAMALLGVGLAGFAALRRFG